jgi:tetratricopeptide (TPR) repeat protein
MKTPACCGFTLFDSPYVANAQRLKNLPSVYFIEKFSVQIQFVPGRMCPEAMLLGTFVISMSVMFWGAIMFVKKIIGHILSIVIDSQMAAYVSKESIVRVSRKPFREIGYLKKRQVYILIVAIFFSFNIAAQQTKIDSLKLVIENSTGIKKFDPLVALLRIYAGPDDNAALTLAYQARQVAFEFGDTLQMVMSSRIVGQLLNRLAKVKEAESVLSETLPIAERNDLRDECKNLLNNLAVVYTIQAKYDEALSMNFRVLDMRERDNDKEDMTISLNNIGFIYYKMKNFHKALEYYTRALRLKMELRDDYFLDRLYINIGLCHVYLKDHPKSIEYFKKAFQVCGGNCTDQIKSEGELGLGLAEFQLKNYEQAKVHFDKSYTLSKKIDNKRFQVENLSSLARISIIEENYEAALHSLIECENISVANGYNEILLNTYRQFSTLFMKTRQFEKASFYQNKFITFKDSIYGEALIDSIAKIQTAFAERENLKTILYKEEVIQRQDKLNIAMAIAAVFGTLLIVVLYRNIRLRKKINQALDHKVHARTLELESSREALHRSQIDRNNFLDKIVKDIQAPAASLKGLVDVLPIDPEKEDIRPFADNIVHATRKLDQLVNNLSTINEKLIDDASDHEPESIEQKRKNESS